MTALGAGREAVRPAKDARVGLVLMDIRRPVLDRLAATRPITVDEDLSGIEAAHRGIASLADRRTRDHHPRGDRTGQ
ncbi:hypothetical protein ACFXDH_00490 [Streptomyces sp. NPDC059467]|uniref:hypothetical protein n=1 Tax=Streptomyces sp. NPDC059467 TaxID=3346844 RepID=UPI0036C50F6E